MRGKDVTSYSYTLDDLYLIATFPSKKYDIEEYQSVKNYFLTFGIERLEQTGKEHIVNGEKIKARKKTSNKWFETQDQISYWEIFEAPKIIYREISEKMDACLIDELVYTNNKCYILTGNNLHYLLAIFNSKFFTNCILNAANLTGGKGWDFMSKVKIPKNPPQQQEITSLVDEILNLKKQGKDTENLEFQIDSKVYELYELTEEEIKQIETN